MFWKKISKYKKGANSRESLRNCNELGPDQRLKKIGIDSHDSKLINLTPDKLVPKEAKYHSNCSKTYTKPGKPLKGQKWYTKKRHRKISNRPIVSVLWRSRYFFWRSEEFGG